MGSNESTVVHDSPRPVERARELRARSTDAECCLWRRPRRRQLGAKFRWQHPFAGYVLDLYCPSAGLVVEIDGAQRGEPEALAHDAERDRILRRLDLRVLRFTNRQVLSETEIVLDYLQVIVHVFHRDKREFYSLEDLWGDAPRLELSEL
jgi:very-short-patch-repair endonuclease